MTALKRLVAVLLAALVVFTALPGAAQTFPPLTGRVVDDANIIPAPEEAALDAKLAALETQSQRQLVVVTLPSLQGYDISDYGYQLGRAWGIGDKGRNDGALLIVAPKERKVRIEVGYGLEPVLTDGLSSLIVQQQILPHFRDGDYPGGIEAGTDAIIQQLELPADQAQKIAADANVKRTSDGGFPVGALIWLAFIFFFFVLPALRGGRRRRFGGTVGNIILWEALNAATRGSNSGGLGGGGFGGGGFGGGGGFSGGGGSFGGGGASGGW